MTLVNKNKLNQNLDNCTDYINDEMKELIIETIESIISKYSYYDNPDNEDLENISSIIIESIFEEEEVAILVFTIYSYDKELFLHSVNVAILSLILSLKANLPKDMIINITIGALLHDVGKLSIIQSNPDIDIFNPKSKEEYLTLQKHCEYGFQMLSVINDIPFLAKKIVLLHHVWEDYEESYDKDIEVYLSYPRIYNNKEVSYSMKDLPSGIVQIADLYDCIIYKRKEYDITTDIVDYINEQKGKMLNPYVVDLFLQYISPYSINQNIVLNTGEIGKILSHTQDISNPIIKISQSHLGRNNKILDLSKYEQVYIKDTI